MVNVFTQRVIKNLGLPEPSVLENKTVCRQEKKDIM